MATRVQEFELKQYHIDLARRMNFIIGADGPEIDPKRPYGSSSVIQSMTSIVGEQWPDEDSLSAIDFDAAVDAIGSRMLDIQAEMATALQIIVGRSGQATRPGWYENVVKYGRPEWKPGAPR